MTPFELVLSKFQFPKEINGIPFDPHPLQIETINELAPLPNSGEWLDMGTGKTFVSTACALYWKITTGAQAFVILPPNLITQWGKWLRRVSPKLSITEYRGTPAERAKLSLEADFVIVGIQIFKRDFKRFNEHAWERSYMMIVDEANSVANIGSDAHEKVYDFGIGHPKALLTGTPINKPGDGYGLLTFTAPGTYRSRQQFENLHVEERDFYDKPIKWKNLELLNSNMKLNSKRILYEDMFTGVQKPHYIPLNYDLEADHYKLYHRLCNDELLKLPDGGKIDATTANRLRHALGQIIVNRAHFAGVQGLKSTAVSMIGDKLDEMGSEKLVVFAHYKMSVAHIVEQFQHVGAVGYNSAVSNVHKDRNKDRFVEDPGCRLIVIQYISGGKGLDGLQHVCNTCLTVEPCQQPRDFHQAIARLHRTGQRRRVRVYLPIADATTQVRDFKNLLTNDTLANQVIRNAIDLRAAISERWTDVDAELFKDCEVLEEEAEAT